jgi:hypothetical protein
MVKPDFYGVVNNAEIQVILPQASEEYGPISHYYLIVVPEDKLNAQKNPDQFLTDEVSSVVSCICLYVTALSVACAVEHQVVRTVII